MLCSQEAKCFCWGIRINIEYAGGIFLLRAFFFITIITVFIKLYNLFELMQFSFFGCPITFFRTQETGSQLTQSLTGQSRASLSAALSVAAENQNQTSQVNFSFNKYLHIMVTVGPAGKEYCFPYKSNLTGKIGK